jgi:hypothetical protein
MAVKSRGRGLVAALGLFLLFAGLVGGGVLYIVAERRPAQTVDGFARAPVGCTTTLEFTETGVFYVFEEVGGATGLETGCQPVADPSAEFAVSFTGDLIPAAVEPTTAVSYDVDGFDGRSVQRVEIAEPGQYTVEVTGDDLTVVAALGRDPDEGVDDLRQAALIVAIAGVVLGLAMLILSGRRSRRAAAVTTPEGPGWGPTRPRDGEAWSPEPPRSGQVPVNPHEPPEPASVTRPPAGADAWRAPSGNSVDDVGAPDPMAPPAPPDPSSEQPSEQPILPDAPGRVSGT